MAVYTKLNQKKIEEILSNYSLGKLDSFKGIEEGIENTNYFLSIDKKKFILTIYEKRVNKSKKSYDGDRSGQFDVAMYTKKYGGQFHFDIIGLSKRKILGMSGFGGQNIIIDFEKERIIVVNSRDRHYNWKKIVLKKLKKK